MIAVDAMGGDYAPEYIVLGAIRAAKKGIPVHLFGDQEKIYAILQREPEYKNLPILVTHALQVISMNDDPIKSVIAKKQSSLIGGLQSVKQGNTQAFVSAGNSGAILVASSAVLGRVDGVKRPAVGAFLPRRNGSFFCLDLGANVDVNAEHLEQFAIMGDIYSRLHGVVNPRVALLSNGHEPSKGSSLLRHAYTLLTKRLELNFVGNIEAREIFENEADVVVCDGFYGNIFLKTAQATAKLMFNWLKLEAHSSLLTKIGLWLSKKSFWRLAEKTNYAMTGGALLLGIQKPVIIAHGKSSAKAIENAVHFAYSLIKSDKVQRFNQELKKRLNPLPFTKQTSVEIGS